MSIFKQKSFDEEFENNNINNINDKSENKIIELNEKLDTITEKIGNLLWRKHKQEQQKQENTSIYFDSSNKGSFEDSSDSSSNIESSNEVSQVSSIFTDGDRFELERLSCERDRLEGAINLEYSLFRLDEDRLQE